VKISQSALLLGFHRNGTEQPWGGRACSAAFKNTTSYKDSFILNASRKHNKHLLVINDKVKRFQERKGIKQQ